MPKKNKNLVSSDLNSLLSPPVFLLNYDKKQYDPFFKEGLFSLDKYGKNVPAIFYSLSCVKERKNFIDSIQNKKYFDSLYIYNKKNQEYFHDTYDPDFSKSGYLKKPLSQVVPVLHSEYLIKKLVKYHPFFPDSIHAFSIFFASLNAEEQHKCYDLFKQNLSDLVYNEDDCSQFISSLKSENLIRQFIIDNQHSFSSINDFYHFSSFINIELESVEGYKQLFSYLNDTNKKKFYELFKSKILIYFKSRKEIAFIINTLDSSEEIKDFISSSKIILKINYKLNKKDKRESLYGMQEFFTNLDTDKFALVLDCLKDDLFYDSSFLSDPWVIGQFILGLMPDKNKVFFESFGSEEFDRLIKDKQKRSTLVNILEKKETSDRLTDLSYHPNYVQCPKKLTFIAKIKELFANQKMTKITSSSSNVNNQFFFMNFKKREANTDLYDMVAEKANLR